ncbi:MAG: hypothetical protein ABSH41_31010 [Syntrophobacteraceae bacterium]|jgi:hypothetical protein
MQITAGRLRTLNTFPIEINWPGKYSPEHAIIVSYFSVQFARVCNMLVKPNRKKSDILDVLHETALTER